MTTNTEKLCREDCGCSCGHSNDWHSLAVGACQSREVCACLEFTARSHAPACPNAARKWDICKCSPEHERNQTHDPRCKFYAPQAKAPEPVKQCPKCGTVECAEQQALPTPTFADYSDSKPAPEPPKREQGGPIDWKEAARLANAWYYANRFEVFGPGRRELARAYLALKAKLATVEAEVERLRGVLLEYQTDEAMKIMLRSPAEILFDEAQKRIATVEAERDILAAKLAEVEKGRDSYIKGKLEEVLLDRNLLQAERDAALRRVEELEVMVEAEACNDGECITVPHATKICVEAREIKRRNESGE